jgi:dihydrofolate synthase/folylpolyglutamate synthase
MQVLAEKLGHPERRYPTLHVAGTNGKGSVCAMLEAVYRRAGLKTGLFASPHLVYLGERVQTNRVPLAPEAIAAECTELRAIAETIAAEDPENHPSFFEFMTATAFRHFARERVDVACIEVGLGGRLDATNVIDRPAAALITSIGLDHVEILGGTLDKIAAEKAGIIKAGAPVFIGLMPPEAEAVIRRIAAERGAPVHSVREAYPDGPASFPETALEGEYQRANAALAALVVRTLREEQAGAFATAASDADIAEGLGTVQWAARWQRMRLDDGRVFILDTTHNEPGAAFLDASLERLRAETGSKPVIITGLLGEFRAKAILPVLARHAERLYFARPNQLRALTYEQLAALVPADFPGQTLRGNLDELFPAPGRVAAGVEGQPVVVTGSIYLVGEIMERLGGSERPSESHLQDGPSLQPVPGP